MKLAIMQPYFLPYLGYFRLIAAVDKFVLLDDVAYIKRGWINRNRILLHDRDYPFVLPLRQASQNRKINDIFLCRGSYWREKLFEKFRHAYHRAPQFSTFFPELKEIIFFPEENLARFIEHSLLVVKDYLEISTAIIPSTTKYANTELKGEARIIDICRREGATDYINLSGGRELYQSESFLSEGITLHFLQQADTKSAETDQSGRPDLSIVHLLMFADKSEVRKRLEEFHLS